MEKLLDRKSRPFGERRIHGSHSIQGTENKRTAQYHYGDPLNCLCVQINRTAATAVGCAAPVLGRNRYNAASNRPGLRIQRCCSLWTFDPSICMPLIDFSGHEIVCHSVGTMVLRNVCSKHARRSAAMNHKRSEIVMS